MLDITKRKQIIDLIKREVIPAIGCTEPIAVALCVARAVEVLGAIPERIELKLSASILKNAMGVGIPGTGMVGLPIAIALGALIGRSESQLEVLKGVTPEDVERGKKFIDEGHINISIKNDISEKLYIEACCQKENDSAVAIISGSHTSFIYLAKNDEVILDKGVESKGTNNGCSLGLNMQTVYDFATTTPIEDLEFILESGRVNKNIAEESFKGSFGHCLGKTIRKGADCKILGQNTFVRILSYTSAACDARMSGAMIPVISNSGSGNQGLTVTIPVVIFAEDNHNTEEELARALILSHLTAIYIKQSLGRLSALCGCIVAATGSSCGITFLMGGGYNEITSAVKNMVANLTGMICDGAKPSCSLKLTSGISAAIFSAMMAIDGHSVTSMEGIIDDDVDQCIQNLTQIASQGMLQTDKIILNIMSHKEGCSITE